jgi:hypothetical protein
MGISEAQRKRWAEANSQSRAAPACFDLKEDEHNGPRFFIGGHGPQ